MIMDRISDYDICCFQELFQTATFRAEDLITAAVKKGRYFVIQASITGSYVNPLAFLAGSQLMRV